MESCERVAVGESFYVVVTFFNTECFFAYLFYIV